MDTHCPAEAMKTQAIYATQALPIRSGSAYACIDVEFRQSEYLNSIVEQVRRALKRIAVPMLGFKYFWSAQKIITGIETMHMVKTVRLDCPNRQPMSAANQFYSLVF